MFEKLMMSFTKIRLRYFGGGDSKTGRETNTFKHLTANLVLNSIIAFKKYHEAVSD